MLGFIVHANPTVDQTVLGPLGYRGILSQLPTPGTIEHSKNSSLRQTLHFGGCFGKPRLPALVWCIMLCSRSTIS